MTIGEIIRYKRQQLGLTQIKFVVSCSIAHVAFFKFIIGDKIKPTNSEFIATIADYILMIGKDFAKFLVDKSQNGVINICDIPDYVKELTVN